MKPLHYVVVIGLLVAGLAVFWTGRNQAAALRQENESLKAELAAAQRSATAKQDEQRAKQSEEQERLRTEASEVHKLRSEVSQLRAGSKELDKLRAENQHLRASNQQLQAAPKTGAAAPAAAAAQEGYYPKETWTFAGYATPEATLQSAVWAMREGDHKTFLASLTPEAMARMEKEEWAGKSEAEISADARKGASKINALRILERTTVSNDEVVLSVYAEGGEDKVQKISMKRFGAEWKLAPKKD